MKPQSAKAKGRNLQKQVRDLLLSLDADLTPDDIRSTSMGMTGEDVQLSSAARKVFPFKIECKSKKEASCYAWYKQAEEHTGEGEPLVVIKKDREKPLVIVDAEWFFTTWKNRQFTWKDIY